MALLVPFIDDTIFKSYIKPRHGILVSKSSSGRGRPEGALLTFPVSLLHPRVLFLKVGLQVLQDLDLEVDGGGAVGQNAVVQVLHVGHKHLAGVHDHKEA